MRYKTARCYRRRTCFLSLLGDTARGKKDFPRLSPFSCPLLLPARAEPTLLFSTVNTPPSKRVQSRRAPSLSVAYEQVQASTGRRGTRSKGGGETRAERKRKTGKERGTWEGGRGDGGIGRSEKIGKVMEEQRRRDTEEGGGSLSPHRLPRAHAV